MSVDSVGRVSRFDLKKEWEGMGEEKVEKRVPAKFSKGEESAFPLLLSHISYIVGKLFPYPSQLAC